MAAILSRHQCVNPMQHQAKKLPYNISDKDEEEVTYCAVCQVECKTPGGFFSHTKSMSHIIRASESGAMETVQDRQSDGM